MAKASKLTHVEGCGKPISDEYQVFTTALRKVLQVSHSDMRNMLEQDKKARASKPRPSASRASREKD